MDILRLPSRRPCSTLTILPYGPRLSKPLGAFAVCVHNATCFCLMSWLVTMMIGCHCESQVSSAEHKYQLAVKHLEATKKLRAEDFEDVVKEAPALPEGHLLLGNIYTIAELTPNRFDKAVSEYDKAIALRPNYTAAYVSRGVAKFLANDITKEEVDDGLPALTDE